jgi:hypothetical protein
MTAPTPAPNPSPSTASAQPSDDELRAFINTLPRHPHGPRPATTDTYTRVQLGGATAHMARIDDGTLTHASFDLEHDIDRSRYVLTNINPDQAQQLVNGLRRLFPKAVI